MPTEPCYQCGGPQPNYFSQLCPDCRRKREAKEHDSLVAERDRLQAIVDQYPKTADGVPITPGTDVWLVGTLHYASGAYIDTQATVGKRQMALVFPGGDFTGQIYSTREAAEAAKDNQPKGSD